MNSEPNGKLDRDPRSAIHDPLIKNQRGFTLIEVLVAVLILATGLVLVVEAMFRSQEIFRISENMTTSTLIAESQLAKAEMEKIEEHDVGTGGEGGTEKFAGRTFEWAKSASEYVHPSIEDTTKLREVDVVVQWKEGAVRQNAFKLSSLYLKEEKK